LSTGANRLADGTDELFSGTAALLEGAGQLDDGLNEFNEQAVDKITDILSNVTPVSDRVEELRSYAATYNTFSGAPEGVEDSVVFVFKNN
jgi:putative membrane protein